MIGSDGGPEGEGAVDVRLDGCKLQPSHHFLLLSLPITPLPPFLFPAEPFSPFLELIDTHSQPPRLNPPPAPDSDTHHSQSLGPSKFNPSLFGQNGTDIFA